jgi:hypothetical protein
LAVTRPHTLYRKGDNMLVHLFCPSTAELKLGPLDEIVFHYGFARFDPEDPKFAGWEKWVAHPSTPQIEILPSDDQVPTTDTDALSCPICAETDTPRAFKNKGGLGSHLRSHEGA